MPYRIDLPDIGEHAFDLLVQLGALDVEPAGANGIAALMPDSVAPDRIARALGLDAVRVSAATGRDADSVWVLSPRPIRIGRIRIVPSGADPQPGAIRLMDAPAFGTGLHPTTALCLEALDEALLDSPVSSALDVGTGSGVLALAALALGVPGVLAIDIDDDALKTAAENARINGVSERLQLARGGPADVAGTWPLVLANILAAPLIELAPSLVRRVGPRGTLVLSGIPSSAESDVHQAYRRLGMHRADVKSRGGWSALVLRASW
jgi:ribosomal protein L11 methyltransferase